MAAVYGVQFARKDVRQIADQIDGQTQTARLEQSGRIYVDILSEAVQDPKVASRKNTPFFCAYDVFKFIPCCSYRGFLARVTP